ncbi:MAG: hypothetical protein Sylvanvirus12_18 [Sylvanvirus sp.]|uniref:Uncharacterized protein n=1 Tax=Sylvanvirus sp. TaxID=2487774 RepID=A0A3G5AI90_9VIRU|nr:MAG: hypothetical protein Sylvanvirus12_18 [Sylvanvirus sp.]
MSTPCPCPVPGLNRYYVGNNALLKKQLAIINGRRPVLLPVSVTTTELSFPHFNASFTKGLLHDAITGSLVNDADFQNMVWNLIHNRQLLFSQLPLAPNSTALLVDPFGALATCLMGADQAALTLCIPPLLSSAAGAAEMVELYAQMLTRDVPFNEYALSPDIANMIGFLNDPLVLANLPDPPSGGSINPQNIFRGTFPGCEIGPYLSQLMWLNVPLGAVTVNPVSLTYPTKAQAIVEGLRVEWGVNNQEVILAENGQLTTFPPVPTVAQETYKYLYAGRNLAEAVHQDASIYFYYCAANILAALNVPWNPTLPSAPNQSNFFTCGSGNAVQHSLAEVCSLALKHAWNWKWNQYRKLRPEVFGLWIDNVQQGRVQNTGNYNINPLIFQNGILDAVQIANGLWGFPTSSTLSSTFREMSPAHPSYPSGHSVVAGACCTILKLFFNADTVWTAISGLQASTLNRRILPSPVTGPVIQANADGSSLETYVGTDQSQMTVGSEINKLGINVAIGRDWAGIHYRTDGMEGMKLGEQVAIGYFADLLSSWVQNNVDGTIPRVQFRKLDGTIQVIVPTISSAVPQQ